MSIYYEIVFYICLLYVAPVAMGTLTAVFKTLMYPKPILLKYLPELLRLSLPGLDASDVAKTTVTLQLYSTVLTWLPVRSSYQAAGSESYPPLHVQLVDPSFLDHNPYSQDVAQVDAFLNRLITRCFLVYLFVFV